MAQDSGLGAAPVAEPVSFTEKVKGFFNSSQKECRSELTLEREKYVFWHPATGQFNRWLLVIPVLATQICIGSLYSWSIFNKTMDAKWGTPGLNANAFTISVALFGCTTGLMGNWVDRNGPFWSVIITILTTPIGWGLASVGSKFELLGLVYFGFALHGIGTGFAYISTCAAIQKWFSEFKGLATGLAVLGFGLGSFIWTTVGRTFLDSKGDYKWLPWQVQAVFAGLFFIILCISVPFLRLPPPDYRNPSELYIAEQTCRGAVVRAMAKKTTASSAGLGHEQTFLEAVYSQEFLLCAIFFFGVEITGIVFLSSASDMTQYIFGYDAAFANSITSALNAANFTGRVFWGFLSDKIGRKTFYMFSAIMQAVWVGLMAFFIQQGMFGGWICSFLIVGSLYGGGFGTIPAAMSDVFGPKISAATHGLMVSVWALGAIIGIPVFGSQTAKYVHMVGTVKTPDAQAYIINSYWLCAMPIMSFIALLLLNVRQKDRLLRMANGDFRVRLFSYVLRINWSKGGLTILNPEQQEAEWDAAVQEESHHILVSVARTMNVKEGMGKDVEAGERSCSDQETTSPLHATPITVVAPKTSALTVREAEPAVENQ